MTGGPRDRTEEGAGGWAAAERRLRRERRGLRRRAGAAWALTALAAGAGIFLALTLLPQTLLHGRGSLVPLAAWGLAVAAAAIAWAGVLRARRGLELHELAAEAERSAGLGPGELRAALELARPRAGESRALGSLHRARVAEAVGESGSRSLFPTASARWRGRLRSGAAAAAGLSLLVVLAAAVRPEATAGAARAALGGWRIAFPPPLPGLTLAPAGARVPRGEWLQVRVGAPGRARATLGWRAVGEPTRRTLLIPDGEGRAVGRIGPLEAPTRYWASASDGAATDTFLVVPVEELYVEALRVRVLYPEHMGREPETHERPVPPLLVPEGARLAIEGRASRSLRNARARPEAAPDATEPGVTEPGTGGAAAVRPRTTPLAVEGARFSGLLAPRRTGRWTWELEPASDAAAGVVPPEPLSVDVVPDARPEVRIVFPGRDTTLGAERVLPLVVDARDDFGLRGLELVSWGTGSGGSAGPRTDPLGEAEGRRRLVVRPPLDLRDRGLLPGDTLSYVVRARDGRPGRGPTTSDTFRVAIASLEQLRRREAEAGTALAASAERTAEAMGELAAAARDASRRVAPPDPADAPEAEGSAADRLGFEGTAEAREALGAGERAEERLEAVEEAARRLGERLAEGALTDPELRAELERLAERYRELRESALGERLRRLEEALQELDRDAVRDALEALAAISEEARAELERSLGLLERAALQQEVAAARAEAEALAERQRRLAGEEPGQAEWAAREAELAAETRRLAEKLERLEQDLEEARAPRAGEAVAEAGEGARRAEAAMETAADAASGERDGPPSDADAGESGGVSRAGAGAAVGAASEAAGSLDQAVEALSSAQGTMSGEWRDGALAALREARREALLLAAEEAALGERLFGEAALDGPVWQGRQTAVREGLEGLERSLREAGRRTGALDPELLEMAREARWGVDDILRPMAESGGRRRPPREAVERQAETLNELALRLLASEEAVRASEPGSAAGEALERMASLARRQQVLAQRTGGLVAPGQPTQGRGGELRRLAEGQAEVGRSLRELEEDGLLGRPEALAREAERLAARLAAGAADEETLQGQRRLFRRMLDAGRSLEGEEIDATRRESRVGRGVPPEAIDPDPDAFAGPRFPHPAEALLRDLPAAYRRLVYEYFDRLNARPPEPEVPGEGGP